MSIKDSDIRWKWLKERGFSLYKDEYQRKYMQSLWAPLNEAQAVFCEAKAGTGKTTLYAKGVNWDKAFVIIDEAQNFDLDELQTVLTRCSDNCKVVLIGSIRQNDNRKVRKYNGLTPFEVYMKHFEDKPVAYHTLVTNYRGWFSDHADNVGETVDKLREGS